MILDVIPVIPPELRPLVPLDGGRFATSDLNDLYRRVINRNNRLKKLMELNAPDVIVRNEKRMLQEAVDACSTTAAAAACSRREQPAAQVAVRHAQGQAGPLPPEPARQARRLLGPLGDRLSARSSSCTSAVCPRRWRSSCSSRSSTSGSSSAAIRTTIKQAKELVEQQDPGGLGHPREVIKDHPVLLNRAPTLHRLGIQAFEPVLVEGKAIKIHPLVCPAFNADFDGDQMAVHVPLSPGGADRSRSADAVASNNILSPATGAPIACPRRTWCWAATT
jgi:DNA-directed RNA polymerase subunit beta'